MTVATAGYARWFAPFMVEYSQVRMPLPDLHRALEGFRIIQFSDLHTMCTTPLDYLQDVVDRINELAPDLVVVTGDLVSHTRHGLAEACDLVGRLKAPTAVSFGNHDYAPSWRTWSSTEIADELQARLEGHGVHVLRNAALPIEREGGRIWLVGLEDLWSHRFDPEAAFAQVPAGEPTIALSHNPDTIYPLERHGAHWVLAGHTHGGQIRVPLAGAMVLPVQHKQFDMGQFRIGRTRMYITRGVGFRQRVRFRCPPEVPCFILERE
jgi:uncharacterized protein